MRMISVCIATYNGEKYIYEQVDSILNQIGDKDEIIVSDNLSTDKTLQILAKFNDERIKIFSFPEKSVIKNFENAIIQSEGDFIFLCDQDDIWMQCKVERCLHHLEEVDLVLSDCSIVGEDLRIIARSYFEVNKSGKGFFKNLITNSYMGCCMAFDRRMVKKILPIPADVHIHDMWIGLIAEVYYTTRLIREPLILHRLHDKNESDTFIGSRNSIRKKILFRLVLIKNLIKTLIR